MSGITTQESTDSSETGAEASHGLLADAPLVAPEQDRLGRAGFARFLAEAIVKLDVGEGFVFALYGPWGSGKSSTLNFVVHYLEHFDSGEVRPIVMRFNPWWFSGQNQLLLQFFGQLRLTLSRPDVPKHLQALGASIQAFARALTPLAYIPVTKGIFGNLNDVIRSLGEAVKRTGMQMEQDVWSLRKEIDKALKEQARQILIVIDDIDRLPASEIQLMFRMIKAVADFPKTTYLLAFDKRVVIDALEDFQGASGEAYLEKIVQAPFDLPLANRASMRRLLFEQLDMVLVGTPEGLWDKLYWANIYWDGIDGFIQTPRDIKRYINVLRPSYTVVCGEVNPVDFPAIEALRVFVPDIYHVVRSNQELFAGSDDALALLRQPGPDQKRRIYERYLELAPEDARGSVSALLKRLFPEYASALGGASYGSGWKAEWRKQLRICSPDIFPIYFRLSLEEGAISNAEMRALLSLASDTGALAQELLRLANERAPDGQTSRAREFLERLQDYTQEDIPVDSIEPILQALYDAGDALIAAEDERGMHDFGNYMRVLRITHQLLQRLPSPQERCEILRTVLSRAASVPMIVHQIAVLGQEHGKFEGKPKWPEVERTVSGEDLAELERIALQRIEAAATASTLSAIPDLGYVLLHWPAWAGAQSVHQFVEELIASDEGLADFLAGFLQRTYLHVSGDRVSRGKWVIHIPSVEKLADLSCFKERAEGMLGEEPDWLTDRQRLALEVFLGDLETKQEGQVPWASEEMIRD
jgi:predicted KAP-like P-loop ATPase